MSSGRFPCFSFRPPQRAQEGESSLSKEREQRPKSGPYPMGGAGTLPLPQSGHTAAHRRSRGVSLLLQEFRHSLVFRCPLQFVYLPSIERIRRLLYKLLPFHFMPLLSI